MDIHQFWHPCWHNFGSVWYHFSILGDEFELFALLPRMHSNKKKLKTLTFSRFLLPHFSRLLLLHFSRFLLPHFSRFLLPHFSRFLQPHFSRFLLPHLSRFSRFLLPHFSRLLLMSSGSQSIYLYIAPRIDIIKSQPWDRSYAV